MTMKRKVLGRGIDAIISNRPVAPQDDKGFLEVDVDSIYPNPYQPRKKFSQERIKDLADSLNESGMIQPVVLYREDEKNYLMVGERRWRAAQYLKWKKIPAIVRDLTHDDIIVGVMVENIQREDLNAIEVAEGIEMLMKEMGVTQEKAGEKLGMNRSTLTNFLRLLKLPEAVKECVISGDISQGHARSLLSLENDSDMSTALSRILKNNLSVRQTEKMVKGFEKQSEGTKTGEPEVDPNLRKTEEKLTHLLSTKVKLHYSGTGKGKIEIFFSQLEEFDRLYNLLAK